MVQSYNMNRVSIFPLLLFFVKCGMQYETERLILRPTTTEDADYVLAVMNTPKWLKYIGDRKVYSREAAEQYIKDKMLPQYHRLGYSNNTVIRKSDGVKMGSCGLYDREGLEGVDIGFAFLPEYEGHGYALEAAQKIIALATTEWNIPKISAITTKDNLSSQRLLEKLGLQSKGITQLPGDAEELLLYELHLNP